MIGALRRLRKMKLKTFDRYSHPEEDISCGTISVALVTGETPSQVTARLNNLRKSKGWSARKLRANHQWMYWDEAQALLKDFIRGARTVYPRRKIPLEKFYKKFRPKEAYLVCTTEHLQIVKDGVIYDAFACRMGKQVEWHQESHKQVYCYIRLTGGKK